MVEGTRGSGELLIHTYRKLKLDNLINDDWKVVLFTPGEVSATGYSAYLTENTTTGQFAKETLGAVVMLEREYHSTGN